MTDPLPAGLTHPHDATCARLETYRYRHTFSWVRGDAYVSVQRGRVANADKVFLVEDAYPGERMLLKRQPVVDWIPAPSQAEWSRQRSMAQLADHWYESRRAEMRRQTA